MLNITHGAHNYIVQDFCKNGSKYILHCNMFDNMHVFHESDILTLPYPLLCLFLSTQA